jgi:hypothetical protein
VSNTEEFDFDKVMNSNTGETRIDDDLVNKIKKRDEKTYEKEVVTSLSKPQKSKEEIDEHQKLILHINRYSSSKRFASYLKSLGFDLSTAKIKAMNKTELEELLGRIQTSLSNKTSSNFWYEMSLGMIETSEKIVVHSPLGEKVRINGLTEALKSNEDYADLIEMIELEYASFSTIRPELRIVYTILTTALKLHSINSFLDKRKEMLEKQQQEVPSHPVETDTQPDTKLNINEKEEVNTGLNFDDEN